MSFCINCMSDMGHLLLLLLLLLLWSSAVQAEGGQDSAESEYFRLVGKTSRCSGNLEMNHSGDWRPVSDSDWTLKEAAVVCEHLDCGSAVYVTNSALVFISMWEIIPECIQSGSPLKDCVTSISSNTGLEVTCSDSVRLVNGTSLCSGRLEVKSSQNNQRWSSVCEDGFDQPDAEVVCRELGCGPPSVLQGALHGAVEGPIWTKEFRCGGSESGLLDCRSSGSVRNTCSPGRSVRLTCSDPLRLVRGASRCAGELQLKHLGGWRPVDGSGWTLKEAAVVCEHLDCGSAVSLERTELSYSSSMRWIRRGCVQTGSSLRDCALSTFFNIILRVTCSDSVRLVNGTSLCSGRLELKSSQNYQRWSSVCEDGFDQPDAEVVCRELGCGPPSVFQGALHGEVEGPIWTKEFQCGGNESGLLDCRSSSSLRNTSSLGRAIGLTCSEPLRLVGGASRCAGELELKYLGDWRPVDGSGWTLKEAAVVCEHLDCGSDVSLERRESGNTFGWWIRPHCVQPGSDLRGCAASGFSLTVVNITCSDPPDAPDPSDSYLLHIKAAVLPLTLLLVNIGLHFYCKGTRGQKQSGRKNVGQVRDCDASAAEEGLTSQERREQMRNSEEPLE